MKVDITLEFEAEIVDEQRLLNGVHSVSIDGRTEHEGRSWSLALSFDRAKGVEAVVEEGDLSLNSDDGTLFAGLESGQADIVIDEIAGSEREVFALSFEVSGGEGRFEGATGQVVLRGELEGGRGRMVAALSVEGMADAG